MKQKYTGFKRGDGMLVKESDPQKHLVNERIIYPGSIAAISTEKQSAQQVIKPTRPLLVQTDKPQKELNTQAPVNYSPSQRFFRQGGSRTFASRHRHNPASSDDGQIILAVILSILIAPLGVYVKDNSAHGKWFLPVLLLWLAGFILFFPVGSIGGVFLFAAVVIAVLHAVDLV